jgi:redox-sensitive bicupin YhaK (pirin superfamily)
MITIRRGHQRGHFDHGWLDTWHTFSFGDYYDPEQMGFSALRVINDDRVAASAGFPMHPHRNMEIVTYVLEGSLAHKDSLGNGSIIGPGEIQRMTAGSGVTHSEFNPSATGPVHLLQIWIEPNRSGLDPSYEQKAFPLEERKGRLRLVASSDGRSGSLTIHQDASLYDTLLDAGDSLTYAISPGRRAYLHVARGDLVVNDIDLHEGDGARIEQEKEIRLAAARGQGEALLFDLP